MFETFLQPCPFYFILAYHSKNNAKDSNNTGAADGKTAVMKLEMKLQQGRPHNMFFIEANSRI